MAYPHKQQAEAPRNLSTSEHLVRDILEVFRERGVESIATPTEINEIAYGRRDIRTVLV